MYQSDESFDIACANQQKEPVYLHPTTKERIFNQDFSSMDEVCLAELMCLCLQAIESMDAQMEELKQFRASGESVDQGILARLKRARSGAVRLQQRTQLQKGLNKKNAHAKTMTGESVLLRRAIREICDPGEAKRILEHFYWLKGGNP